MEQATNELANAKTKLDNAESKLDKAESKLDNAELELADSKKELERLQDLPQDQINVSKLKYLETKVAQLCQTVTADKVRISAIEVRISAIEENIRSLHSSNGKFIYSGFVIHTHAFELILSSLISITRARANAHTSLLDEPLFAPTLSFRKTGVLCPPPLCFYF